MKRILYIVGIILVIILGMFFQCKCSRSCHKTAKCSKSSCKKANKTCKLKGGLATFNLKDGDFSIDCKDNFDFTPSKYAFQKPVPADLQNALGKLKDYLAQDKNRILNLQGFYADFEQNNSAFANLGLARANAVKGYLISQGFDRKQLNIEGELTDKLDASMPMIKGAIGYKLAAEDEASLLDKLKELKLFGENLKQKPINLYFETGATNINLSDEERKAIFELEEYLSKVDDAALLVVGHTDNTGKRDLNVKISKERADFVKNYLVRNGFDANAIETLGKGPDHPIATNDTEQGKAKNRRVTITLK